MGLPTTRADRDLGTLTVTVETGPGRKTTRFFRAKTLDRAMSAMRSWLAEGKKSNRLDLGGSIIAYDSLNGASYSWEEPSGGRHE